MFFGHFHHRLNAKNQVTVPASFRRLLPEDEKLNVARWDRDCLYLLTQAETVTLMERMHERGGSGPGFHRILASRITPVDMDAQGRIVIPAEFKKAVGIDADVAFVGNAERIEVWAFDRWQEFEAEHQGEYEEKLGEVMGDLFKY